MAITNVAARNWKNGNPNLKDWYDLSASNTNVHIGYVSSANYVAAIRFTTDVPITKINMHLKSPGASDWANTVCQFNYKICASEEEMNACVAYNHSTSGDGVFTYTTGYYYTNDISISRALDAGTYYIMIWRNVSSSAGIIYWLGQPLGSQYSEITATNAAAYTVSFNANGGTGAPSAQTKYGGIALTISSTKPTKANSTSTSNFTITGNANGGDANTSLDATKITTTTYTFNKWNTESDGSGTPYDSGGSYETDAADTLYAQWNSISSNSYSNNSLNLLTKPTRSSTSAGKYTVTFGGSGTPSSASLDAAITTSYKFNHWDAKSDGSGTDYTDSSSFTSATTVYAIWDSSTSTAAIKLPGATRANDNNKPGYTVAFDGNGGNDAGYKTSTKNIAYTFMGWSDEQNAAAHKWKEGINYTPTVNHTLYSVWSSAETNNSITLPSTTRSNDTIAGYKVTFNGNGGIAPSAQTSTKTRVYTLSGWSDDQNATTHKWLAGNSKYTPTVDHTLYAIWNYSDTNNSITLPTPTRSGYDFLGWATSSGGNVIYAGGDYYTPTEAVTLYAVWGANGLVYIHNGTAFETYAIYIYNGSSWNQYIPYIYNGSKWVICS